MIDTTNVTRVIRLSGMMVLAMMLTACAAQTTQHEPAEPATEANSYEPWEGDGMEIPLDGSSLDAFETSLARVKAHTSAEHYTTLVNSIEYLLFYDLPARRDRATLASRLDGLTPNEVIEKVEGWRTTKPGTPDARAPDSMNEL